MPDLSVMSGKSMPAPQLPDGTVTVRVVRDQITNNVPGVPVELHGAGAPRKATTGADGRAEFSGVPAGAQVHAVAVVGGQRLESQPFEMPASGGVRTLLAATGEGGAAGSGAPSSDANPSQPLRPSGSASSLSIGANSRIATQFSDDVLQVYYLLEIVNRSGAPVTPRTALVFDMPTGAEGTTVLEGSTKAANAKGTRVTVNGPFPPGTTPLQIAFRLDALGPAASITSRFPLPMDAVSFAVQKIGPMTVSSTQVSRLQDAPMENTVFAIGMGPPLQAATPLVLHLGNLPHRSRTPVYIALALACGIIGIAAWALVFPGHPEAAAARRRDLLERREKGLAALAGLEEAHRAGRLEDAEYAGRRATLLAQLERVYGELDADRGASGGQDAAA